jgi:DNA adenine methylase
MLAQKNRARTQKRGLEIPISSNTNNIRSKPFLKWVGGKTQIIEKIEKNLPKDYGRYFEPFVGGGAVFFHLIDKNREVYLSDINKRLTEAYLHIRDEIYDVMLHLDKIAGAFVNIEDEKDRERYFFDVRAEYNSLIDSEDDSPLRTAQLIFLNKTCFNGVYRENSKGHFNVPYGKVKRSNSIARSNILAVSRDLQNTEINNKHFSWVLEKAQKGDLIYFDPPYVPLKQTSAFTKYHSTDFVTKDHEELAKVFEELDKRGCFVMLSNSDTPLIRDLYKKYDKYTVVINANRNINCKGNLRKPVQELLIKNY